MPSRKRSAGKARKEYAKACNSGLFSLNDDNKCNHGCDSIPKKDICYRFVEHFESELKVVLNNKSITSYTAFVKTFHRLRATTNDYEEILNDDSIQMRLLPILLSTGTNLLLKEQRRDYFAFMASTIGRSNSNLNIYQTCIHLTIISILLMHPKR